MAIVLLIALEDITKFLCNEEGPPRECAVCEAYCDECISATTCVECSDTHYLLNGDCFADFSAVGGYFNDDGPPRVCGVCEMNCDECISATTCVQCSPPYYLLNDDCFADCPGGFFNDDGPPRVCGVCEMNCDECNSPTNCLVCSDPYALHNGDCVFCDPATLGKDDYVNLDTFDFYYDSVNEDVIVKIELIAWELEEIEFELEGSASNDNCYFSTSTSPGPFWSNVIEEVSENNDTSCIQTIELNIPIGEFSQCSGVEEDLVTLDNYRILSANFKLKIAGEKTISDDVSTYTIPFENNWDKSFVWNIPISIDKEIDVEILNTLDYLQSVATNKIVVVDPVSLTLEYVFLYPTGGIFENLEFYEGDCIDSLGQLYCNLTFHEEVTIDYYYMRKYNIEVSNMDCHGFTEREISIDFEIENTSESIEVEPLITFILGMADVCGDVHDFNLNAIFSDDRSPIPPGGEIRLREPMYFRIDLTADLDFQDVTLRELRIHDFTSGNSLRNVVSNSIPRGISVQMSYHQSKGTSGKTAWIEFDITFGDEDEQAFYTAIHEDDGRCTVEVEVDVDYTPVRRSLELVKSDDSFLLVNSYGFNREELKDLISVVEGGAHVMMISFALLLLLLVMFF